MMWLIVETTAAQVSRTARDLLRDLVGSPAALLGERFHFAGNDRKTLAGHPGSGRFHGCVQGQ
jgi:hypothetical protein